MFVSSFTNSNVLMCIVGDILLSKLVGYSAKVFSVVPHMTRLPQTPFLLLVQSFLRILTQ